MQSLKAVITGDLINSRQQPPEAVEQAMAVIARQASLIAWQCAADTRFTRHRGDGWQIYLDIPGICLSAALQIVAALRASDSGLATRQSIGIGPVTTLPKTDLAAAQGLAFELSGIGLDQMDNARRLTLSGQINPYKYAIITLADWHSARWSAPQAEAMRMALESPEKTQGDLAATLGITRQALQARLSGAGFAPWSEAVAAFQSEWENA